MNAAERLWRRSAQTRTSVHGAQSEKALRCEGAARARRVLAGVMIAFQMATHATLALYERAGSAAWQATLMQLLPIAALWLIAKPGATKGAKWPLLLLLPCLLLDACYALIVADVLAQHMLPSLWPEAFVAAALALSAMYATLTGGEDGVAYGASQFRWLFVALLPLCTVGLSAGPDTRLLSPALGEGVGTTALAALGACGGVWGVALLWLAPDDAGAPCTPVSRGQTLAWTLPAFGAALLWTFWLCLCAPWRPGEDMLIADRLLALPRQAGNLIFGSLCGIWWLIASLTSLCGAASYAAVIVRACRPRFWRTPWIALVLGAALLGALLPRGAVVAWLLRLSPWRLALSAAALFLLRLPARGGRRRG